MYSCLKLVNSVWISRVISTINRDDTDEGATLKLLLKCIKTHFRSKMFVYLDWSSSFETARTEPVQKCVSV